MFVVNGRVIDEHLLANVDYMEEYAQSTRNQKKDFEDTLPLPIIHAHYLL